jgi:hypothetical protein
MTQENIQISDTPVADGIYSGDVAGLKEAAPVLLRKRGEAETGDAVIGNDADEQGPVNAKDAIKVGDGAREVTEWRKQREQQRQKFEEAVFGADTPGEEDAARFDAITKPDELAAELHKSANAEVIKAEAAIEAERREAPPPAPLNALEAQLQNYVVGEVEKAHRHVVNQILQNYPEAGDQEMLNALREVSPERYAEIASAYGQAEQALKLVQSAAQHEAAKAHSAVRSEYESWAAAEDKKFAQAHPELRDAKVQAEVFQGAIAYLKSLGMSEQDIVASWNGTGPINIRHAAAQETLLKAARYDMAKKSLATRPRSKNVPKVQRPGVRGDVEPRSRFADLEQRFERSGSARDAGRLIAARREAARRGR